MSPLSVFVQTTAAALAFGATAIHAQPQDWPDHQPIRIVVAYPFGGISYLVASVLAERLSLDLNTSVLVENIPDAAGKASMDAVTHAAPDGLTLGFASISSIARNLHLNEPTYDPHRGITPVVSLMYSPILLVATPSSTVKDFNDLINQARAQPGIISWATLGAGSASNYMVKQVTNKAKVSITHIPYKGAGLQMQDALDGRFTVMSINLSPMLSTQLAQGTLRALAIGAPDRVAQYPDVPTFRELGYPQANVSSHFGLYAPAGTSREVVMHVNQAVNTALQDPSVAAFLSHTNNVVTGGAPEAFAKAIADAVAREAAALTAN